MIIEIQQTALLLLLGFMIGCYIAESQDWLEKLPEWLDDLLFKMFIGWIIIAFVATALRIWGMS